MAIFTLGHSTYSSDEFLEYARGMAVISDVRSHPGSAKYPQFNKETMESWLMAAGLQYIWEPSLGGWTDEHADLAPIYQPRGVNVLAYRGKFPKQLIAKKFDTTNTGQMWNNRGLYDYSWFMTTDIFLDACDSLIVLGNARDVAIVCAEALWYKCHRSMISDYLLWCGVESTHIIGKRRQLHSAVAGNRLERYHPDIVAEWRRHHDH